MTLMEGLWQTERLPNQWIDHWNDAIHSFIEIWEIDSLIDWLTNLLIDGLIVLLINWLICSFMLFYRLIHYYWCYIGHKIPAFIADMGSFCSGQRPRWVSWSVLPKFFTCIWAHQRQRCCNQNYLWSNCFISFSSVSWSVLPKFFTCIWAHQRQRCCNQNYLWSNCFISFVHESFSKPEINNFWRYRE